MDRFCRPKVGSSLCDAGYHAPGYEGRVLRRLPSQQLRGRCASPGRSKFEVAILFLFGCALASALIPPASAQAASSLNQSASAANLPDAPQPQGTPNPPQPVQPCHVKDPGPSTATASALSTPADSGHAAASPSTGTTTTQTNPCPHRLPIFNWYVQLLRVPDVKPLTVGDKAHLATHNLLDPFNLITIAGEAGISVAANPHSGYGPGFPGFGRYVGVSFTQDMTGEFFDTFLIPSLTHQDPRYYRMPNASIPRRTIHAISQVFWAQGDNGKGMPNYGNLAGFAIDDAIGNLYVPGQRTNLSSSVERYAVGLATAPAGNLVIEFLPDVARHIHVQVVIIQRIINQVARTGGPVEP